MTIELTCPQCSSHLQVPQEIAGSNAQCPACEQVFEVKATDSPPVRTRLDVVSNPYAAPTSELDTAAMPLAPPIEPGRIQASLTFSLAWQLLIRHLPVLLATHTTVLVVELALGLMSRNMADNGQAGMSRLVQIAAYPVQWYLMIGLTIITLGVARGRQVEFADLFSGGVYFLRFVIFMVLYLLLVLIGTLAMIIPGIYFAIRFWPGAHFIVDQNCTVGEAFALSDEFSAGNMASGLVVGLQATAVLLAGVLMFIVGLFVAFPIFNLMWTIAYLMMTRQSIRLDVTS